MKGRAKIVLATKLGKRGSHPNDGEPTLLDDALDLRSAIWGRSKYFLRLEVTPEHGSTYVVDGTHKVPNRMGGLKDFVAGLFNDREVAAGVEVPVRIDGRDLDKVEIDWDGFVAEGGLKSIDGAKQARREERVADIVGADPRQVAAARAQLPQMVEGFKAGRISAKDMEQFFSEHLQMRWLTQDEVDEGRRQAGL